jgi:ribosomal protein S18 acetylase RimI-like enzyme
VVTTGHQSIVVKPAKPEDLKLLFNVCRQSYAENFAHHWNEGGLDWYLEKVYGVEGIKSDLVNSDINYFMAFFDNEPAGFMKLHLNSDLLNHPPGSGMEIEKIYFRPQFQGKGIGKKLMTVALEVGRKLRKEIIWLGVIDTNENAIEFYKKMGFEIHDRTTLDLPSFKEELKGMWRMAFRLGAS